ncbi:DMT family transporter [Chakrabartyella piscis]|uniref:DMT family transporter n=1 Tax=Chakrabartyella piscis TaxID=2918914 RepID=UPI002958C163|nr:DMT family transporter [Chakrabartyella piscis]
MSKKSKMLLCACITVLFWASAFPMTKVAQAHFTPIPLAFVRCTVASTVLLIAGFINKIKIPKKKDIPLFLMTGAGGFGVYMIAFNTGLLTITAATSSIIIAITPIITAAVGTVVYKEKIKPLGWVAIASAFIGVLVLLLWDGILSLNIGTLLTLFAAFVFSAYHLVSRKLLQRGYTSLEITTYSIFFGALMCSYAAPAGFAELSTANVSEIGALVFLAMVPSAMAFFLWGKALSYAEKTSDVTNFMFVTPLLSTIMGFILLGEVPNLGSLIGGVIIVASIVTFNKVAFN